MSVLTCHAAIERTPSGIVDSEFNACADSYISHLTTHGYQPGTIANYVGCVWRFGRWLIGQRIDTAHIDERVVDCFLRSLLPSGEAVVPLFRQPTNVRAALRQFLAMIRSTESRVNPCPRSLDPISIEVEEYDRYLVEVRGLVLVTRTPRCRHVRGFLVACCGDGPLRIDLLGPADVKGFCDRYTVGWKPASINALGNSLRSYFAYRASHGDSVEALRAAIPSVAHWRHAGLPQGLTAEQITLLLAAFDRHSATGMRDYAIARCLLDLGLRRTEVARLCLEDFDWYAGTVRIHGKGKRIDVLPLPDATGRAIAAYLQNGRPPTTRREVFVRHRPPVNAPADPDMVRNAVRNAAKRCGLETLIRGTHIFRHTVACRLVQHGASLKDIADILRHRSLDTTTIYAKVDLQSLAQVALPWPGRSA